MFDFVNRNFVAEIPRIEGEENQNVHWWDNQKELTTQYTEKAIQLVCMHNIHCCAAAINGCKKNDSDRCRRGYSCTETIEQTYVDDLTDRVIYQHQQSDDFESCNI